MGHRQSPSTQDNSHCAFVLASVRLQPLRHQLQESRVSELIDRADGRSGLHGGSNEAFSAAEFDHFFGRFVDVHPRDSVYHHRARALGQRLAEVLVGGGDAAHQLEDGSVEGDHQCTGGGEGIARRDRAEVREGKAGDEAADGRSGVRKEEKEGTRRGGIRRRDISASGRIYRRK